MASPSYKAKNTLTFEHVFARLGDVEVSAADGYTISGVSITVTPKTGGTYNMRTGAGKTDGTGWSSLTTGTATAIANATPGTKSNDIYLVPGTYTLTASWTAERGGYTENIAGMTADVVLTGGKVNKITTTLGGNAEEVVFGVSINPWGAATVPAVFPTKDPLPSFAGLNIAPAPLYYNGTSFEIKDDDWNHDSYGSIYGKNSGSYYFSFIDLGSYFDADGGSFSTSSGSIDNANTLSYGDYDDWRVPTKDEWVAICTTSSAVRAGSTVNGSANKHYALIQLTGVTHAGSSTPNGLLLFPDGKTVTGNALSGMDNTTQTTGVTAAELNAYLDQGCAFLPASGGNNSSFGWDAGGSEGYYWSATDGMYGQAPYFFRFSTSTIGTTGWSKGGIATPIRLVRE